MDYLDFISSRLIEASGGAEAGTLEIVKTPFDKVLKLGQSQRDDLLDRVPNLAKNYELAKTLAKKGSTLRKDMPVITTTNVRELQAALKSGKLDIRKPFGNVTDNKNPFPDGLKGKAAKDFLEAGLAIHDGSDTDDIVNVKMERAAVDSLTPIQKQIYAGTSIGFITKSDFDGTKKFLGEKSFTIISNDNRIIDGHHRWLAAMLIDPKMKINVIRIDLPLDTLLKFSLAYGDAIGNKRNK